MEHANSSCFTLPEVNFSGTKEVKGIYGITSHEFWHLWNVKRIRPAALWPYDYSGPQYTQLHWFTEGVTDYYADLTLTRCGLKSKEDYFKSLSANISNLENSYATSQVSSAASSWDSWLSGSEYQDPHMGTSYYPLGHRVGLLLDLEIRRLTQGKKSLDDVFRYLYNEYYKNGKGVPEEGIEDAVEKICGQNLDDFFLSYVTGTKKIDYDKFLEPFGLEMTIEKKEKGNWADIGIERIEKAEFGVYLRSVRPMSDASKAGLGDKDIIITIGKESASAMDESKFFKTLSQGQKIPLKVFRDGATLEMAMTYTGNDIGKTFEIRAIENPGEDKKAMLNAWLRSLLAK